MVQLEEEGEIWIILHILTHFYTVDILFWQQIEF